MAQGKLDAKRNVDVAMARRFQNAVEHLLESIFQIMELPIVLDTFAIGIPIAIESDKQIFISAR